MATSTIDASLDCRMYALGNLTLPTTLTVPSGSRSVIFLAGPWTGKSHGVITVACNTTGGVHAAVIGGTVTVTTSTNALTISDASGSIPSALVITYGGDRITT